MSRSYLRLQFRDYEDGTCELFAHAEADGFAGEAGACFSIDELESFAAAIAVYPLPKDTCPSIAGGYWKKGEDTLEQEHLGISVFPINARGHLGVQVRMATELYEDVRPESQKVARLEIVTTYEPLAKFSRELVALVRGRVDEVIFNGEERI